jgi:UDP-N-acetylmuramoyl-tripeptide--D-alanyl-D-alanine ligase
MTKPNFFCTQTFAKILNLPCTVFSNISSVTTDSRKIKASSCFVAIIGDNMDGHQFIPQAIKSGAICILAQKDRVTSDALQQNPQVQFLLVDDVIIAFRKFAGEYRQQYNIPVIAVIGSVGKTTTKEFIASMLTGKFQHVQKTLGSQNGFLGIAITIMDWQPNTDAAVVEIGIDDIGAMEQHIDLVRPTHTVLTQTGPEHLHQLKDESTAAREELLGLSGTVQLNGAAFYNALDPVQAKWATQNASPFLFSFTASNDADCPLPGDHHLSNFAAAKTLVNHLGLSSEQILAGLKNFKTATGRTEIHHLNDRLTVLADHYNSNPTSLKAALLLLQDYCKQHDGIGFAVLGDMLELGLDEERYHRVLALEFASPDSKIKKLILFGPRMRWLFDEMKCSVPQVPVNYFESIDACIDDVKKTIQDFKLKQKPIATLIKGSRGMKLERVLDAIKI